MIQLREAIPAYHPGMPPGTGYDIDIVVGADVQYHGVHDHISAVHLHTLDRAATNVDVPIGAILIVINTVNRSVAVCRAVGSGESLGDAVGIEQLTMRFIGGDRENNSVHWRDWLAWVWRHYKPVAIPWLMPKGADT